MNVETSEARPRTSFLGGSDAAAVMGLSRWSTPLQIWAKKTGQIPENSEESIPMRVGKALEPTVRALFEAQTGKRVIEPEKEFFHPVFSFLGCHVDGVVEGENAIYEAKTATAYKQKEWDKEDIPPEYILQCMHNLAVTGLDKCYLAVLIGNHDFRVKEILPDEELIREMMDKEVRFWNIYVLPRIMPREVTALDTTVLTALYPKETPGETVDLDAEAASFLDERAQLTASVAAMESRIAAIENRLRVRLGDHESGVADGWRVTWKAQETWRLDTPRFKKEQPDLYGRYAKATTSRVLRISEDKTKGE